MTSKDYARSVTQVNKALAALEDDQINKVIVVQGEGYVYISSDDDTTLTKICGLYTSSIPVCKIRQQTVEQWIKDVKDLMNQDDPKSAFYQTGRY